MLTLVGLTIALPDPASWWGEFTTVPQSGAANAVDAVGGALLAAAAIVVWVLLGWCLLVGAALCMARLPGDAGHAGRATLRRLAPLPAVRVLGLAVGLSVVAGTSACAAPLMAADSGSSTAATASASGTRAGVPSSPAFPATPPSGAVPSETAPPGTAPTGTEPAGAVPSGTVPAGTVAVDIDWPSTTAPAATVTGAQGVSTPVVAATDKTAPSAEGSHPRPGASVVGRDGAERPARAGPESNAVTVRPGDSLWAIAQRALPAPATDDAIDTTWRAWYLANATVIGDNPDVIRPGQVLQPPSSKAG